MSYGYGGRPNPYDQRDGQQGGYGGGPVSGRAPPAATFGQGPRPGGGGPGRYNQGPAMGRDDYGSSNVEMASLAQNASSFGQGDQNAILNECREIDRGIDQIDASLNQLRMLQDRSLTEADTSSGSSTSRQLDNLSAQTMDMYRELTDRVRKVKSNSESRQPRNTAQVGRVDRRLKKAIQDYQTVEAQFRKKTQDQMARQYRIVRPDADESEVRAAVEDTSGNSQVFQQALMQGNRMGQARAVLSAVQDRHAALQRIEQQMIELAQLFEQLNTLIVEQDVKINAVEQKSEEVVENLDKGNEEIAVAVQTAIKTRKKKWICLGIIVAILVVVAIIVVVYIFVNKAANSPKRRSLMQPSILDDLQMNTARAVEFAGERPVSRVYAQSKIVVPNSNSDPSTVPLAAFPGSGPHIVKSRIIKKRFVLPDDWSDDDAPAEK
ncbi:t-SNARE [Apodospora peruviana]|uniref:t-SNARE n=1 Tax=Apodospora peruviana TaxID=516989 RepID=A0AAE0IBI4_9PEZI|nr:t-SNARE [Apodospora peruviana]